MKKKFLTVKILRLAILAAAALCLFAGCGGDKPWFEDKTEDNPVYHNTTFILQLRLPTDETETETNDVYPHSKTDGELIYEWEIPTYGNTVYESVKKFFEDRTDSITFRLSEHKFYMFHSCTLNSGDTYNLENAYIAADGVYSYCANYQSVLGADGLAGTEDDLKVVVLVYKGWLY